MYHFILTLSRSTKSNLKHMILCITKIRNTAVLTVSPIVAYFILRNQDQPKHLKNKFLEYLRQPLKGCIFPNCNSSSYLVTIKLQYQIRTENKLNAGNMKSIYLHNKIKRGKLGVKKIFDRSTCQSVLRLKLTILSCRVQFLSISSGCNYDLFIN